MPKGEVMPPAAWSASRKAWPAAHIAGLCSASTRSRAAAVPATAGVTSTARCWRLVSGTLGCVTGLPVVGRHAAAAAALCGPGRGAGGPGAGLLIATAAVGAAGHRIGEVTDGVARVDGQRRGGEEEW